MRQHIPGLIPVFAVLALLGSPGCVGSVTLFGGSSSSGSSGSVGSSGSGGSGSSSSSGSSSGSSGAGSSGSGSSSGGSSTSGSSSGGQPGVDFYVAPTGSDDAPGTRERPFKTLAAAQAAVRASPSRGVEPVRVTVLGGTYYQKQPLTLTPADSGTAAAPVTWQGGGVATLSGGARLDLSWTPYQGGILQAKVPAATAAPLSFDVLYLNGQRQRMARYPNYRPGVVPFGGGSSDAVSSSRVARWTHSPVGGFVHGLHWQRWGSEHFAIKGVDGDHNLVLDGPYCNARPAGLAGDTQVVENVFDELDDPGEWYFDRAAGILYVYPPQGVDLATATVEVAGIERVIELRGTSSAPVRGIVLDGFRISHTSRTFTKCSETILRSDWNIYRGGAVFITGAEDVAIRNGFFDQTGGAGVFVSGYGRRVIIEGNRFIGTGSSAILFMGLSSAVRNPSFGYYAPTIPVADLDKTPGPKTDDYPAQCAAIDNLIHDIGDPEKQVAGIGIDMAQDITVSHNSIYSVPRAGINIGDGCWGGHVIEYNDVFDTVLETGDHGAFNSWGRDRYWVPSVGEIEGRVASHPGLELLDVVKPITLRNNRWRCDHGWDVDLDDGSSRYVITDNIFLAGGLKWREGYQRTGDNNMFADGAKMSVHVWPRDNRDVFTHNVFAGYEVVSPDGFGQTLDHNLFTDAAALGAARGRGTDASSAAGSAGYVDPANGDYRLGPTSPAIALGITSVPVDGFGVKSLALRAQARTPYFGSSSSGGSTRDPTPQSWRGATVKNLVGLDEQSATGIGGDVGVLVVTVPAGSQAAADGLKVLDVVLQLDGAAVASLDDLNRLYGAAPGGKGIALGVHRLQQDITVTITR
jgi:hypothetical protein